MSYSVSDIQDYFEYIIKTRKNVTDNPPIRVNVKKIEKRITFKTKTRYYLKRLISETLKLFRSTKSKITSNKIGENMSHFKIIDVVLGHCKFANNDYQQYLRVLHTFAPNKSFGQLSDTSPIYFIFL